MGCQISQDFWEGVPNILPSDGGSSFPEGVLDFLGKIAWGCQISRGANFPVTPPCSDAKNMIGMSWTCEHNQQMWLHAVGHVLSEGVQNCQLANCMLEFTVASFFRFLQGADCTTMVPPLYSALVRGILEWYGHCRRQCIEVCSDGLSVRSTEKIFTFIFLLSGWALVVPSCFALHCH